LPSRVWYGAPDNKGTAASVYAPLKGLAGMKDDGLEFDKTILAMRWDLAGTDDLKASTKKVCLSFG